MSTTLPLMNTKINNNNNENESDNVSPITISKDAIKRLLKDIQQIIKSPLHDQGL